MSNSLRPHGLQHARLPCPPLSPAVCSNSCPLSWWSYFTISSSATLFSSCLQHFPASGSFPKNQFFASHGQSTGASASASVFPMNIKGWFPLGLTDLISLQSKELSRVFCSTTIWKSKAIYQNKQRQARERERWHYLHHYHPVFPEASSPLVFPIPEVCS